MVKSEMFNNLQKLVWLNIKNQQRRYNEVIHQLNVAGGFGMKKHNQFLFHCYSRFINSD
ncbi:unnamed protein product [Paramecium sonneborni]|uniref:Uncharacterized protein n=1 Tax=Paramecium sonneborni TaxID=65129 RepID=A0A8S1QJ53_9CILI|nr:unnamed protein product [Paramecium sonneborni]